jgi:hypothetical protein
MASAPNSTAMASGAFATCCSNTFGTVVSGSGAAPCHPRSRCCRSRSVTGIAVGAPLPERVAAPADRRAA